MALRPYWSGQIRLSLVSLPVNIYPALSHGQTIPLYEIYRPTKQRVRHQDVVEGQPIDREDIVKGYEVGKGEYVLLEPDEIKELKIPSKRILEITQFVDKGSIDQIYFETPYFVTPEGKGSEDAFAIIREALRDTGKIGLGQLAIGGRERLCIIQPFENGMMLETLRYQNEIRNSDPYFSSLEKSTIDREQLSLAKELIYRKTADFKPEKFRDHYRDALQELINAKLEHRKPKSVVQEKPESKMTNLLDALRKSLQAQDAKRLPKKQSKPRSMKKASRKGSKHSHTTWHARSSS
jgi:DNA end-binding protein Ku